MKIFVRRFLCLSLGVILLGACAQKEPEQPPATPATPAAQQPAQPTPATPPAKQEAAATPAQSAPAGQPAATPQPAAAKPAATTSPAAPSALQSVPAQAAEKVAENKLQPVQQPAPTPTPAPAPAAKTVAAPAAVAKDVIILKAALGGVRFEHKLHAETRKIACERCHHADRAEKPNVYVSPQPACSKCHTPTATAPMKTKLQAAFHNPTATAGTCIDCHKAEVAKGKPAPVKCLDCHKKENK